MKKQEWVGKIDRARYIERNICSWLKRNRDSEATLVEKYDPKKDIISPKLGDVEVKEDRMAHFTGFYAIEYEDGHGKPSGVEGTESKFFVIVDNEHVCMMATESLKYIIRDTKNKRQVEMGFKFDDGEKSKGWLIPRDAILNSPYVEVIKRWFPVLQEQDVRH